MFCSTHSTAIPLGTLSSQYAAPASGARSSSRAYSTVTLRFAYSGERTISVRTWGRGSPASSRSDHTRCPGSLRAAARLRPRKSWYQLATISELPRLAALAGTAVAASTPAARAPATAVVTVRFMGRLFCEVGSVRRTAGGVSVGTRAAAHRPFARSAPRRRAGRAGRAGPRARCAPRPWRTRLSAR